MYSVHVDALDDQHKQLFDIANHLIDVFESGKDDLLLVINDLVNYVTVHFHDEQIVMMNAKYPDLLNHSKVHQKFIEKAEEFIQQYAEGHEDLGFNMVVFLKDWLREHTTKMDMQYADYLLRNATKTR
jgi:hemerythrin-like metal-binding protein